MNLASPADGPSRRSRRGVTLIEMLVVVALVVLMMTILASIFQAATGAMSASRVFTELDNNLRAVDITLRADLENVTARFTPPLDPRLNLGYFEYGENAPSDLQGEDTDDYLAFTVKAPEGQPFTGRVWINPTPAPGGGTYPFNAAAQPVTISSDFAEVIYFLRKGNLYRRVLLIVPERNGSITQQQILAPSGVALTPPNTYQPGMLGNLKASWMAVNDISAHPSTSNGAGLIANAYTPIANTLGDLTNRENRYARSRFSNDFYTRNPGQNPFPGRDSVADDFNFDGIDDYYPTLTWSQVHQEAVAGAGTVASGGARLLINESSLPGAVAGNPTRLAPPGLPTDVYAFPFIYPGMYSAPEKTSVTGGVGWLHAIDYNTTSGVGSYNVGGGGIGQANGVNQGNVNLIANQAPIQEGDSLPSPTTSSTWWGFPTWRETASLNWGDPVFSLTSTGPYNVFGQQPLGLQTFSPLGMPVLRNPNFLPPLGSMPPDASYPQLNTYAAQNAYPAPFQGDDAGSLSASAFTVPAPGTTANPYAYNAAWDDDLIMTGVRSFDVKAYDPNASAYTNFNGSGLAYTGGYYDLGYASTDLSLTGQANPLLSPPAIGGLTNMSPLPPVNGVGPFTFQDGNFNPLGFGHEGRMPPLTGDRRVDPNRPTIRDPNFYSSFSNPSSFPNNVGDDDRNQVGIIRLRRVWDSWSTAYTQAPGVDLATGRGAAANNNNGDDRPVYPSYPPPYPQPLRGIQVQIRVVDPKNEKVKVLTIRQDFSDKL